MRKKLQGPNLIVAPPLLKGWVVSGQTVIEMLVVLSVTSLLFAMVGTFSRASQLEAQVRRQAEKLAADLRQVQDIAYLSQEYEGKTPCGYALQLKSKNYQVMVVNSGSDPPHCDRPNTFTYTPARKLSNYEVQLQVPVEITGASRDTVIFIPPEPKTYFRNTDTGGPPALPMLDSHTLQIKLGVSNFSYTVKVNDYGGISL